MNDGRATGYLILIICCLFVLIFLLTAVISARAHDGDHPEFDEWFASLMQPDNPTVPCCGKTDGYWCDDYYAKGDKAFCRVTDDRVIPGRPPVAVGTEIEIPARKLKWDRGNPTGHSVVFMNAGGAVFCFVQAGGV